MFNRAMQSPRWLRIVIPCLLAACSGGGGGKGSDADAVNPTGGATGDVGAGGSPDASGTPGTTGPVDADAGGGGGTGGLTGAAGADAGAAGRTGGNTSGAGRTATSGGGAGTTGGGASGGGATGGTGGKSSTVARDAGADSVAGRDAAPADAGSVADARLAGEAGSGEGGVSSGVPAGWLYTVAKDNKIYLSHGSGGSVWMGRGVNIDDLFLCGYNNELQMSNPTGEAALNGIVANLITEWKPTLLRTSLGMNSYAVVSWLGSSAYKTAMINVIKKIGTYPGVYVLVTLRSDTSMVDTDGSVCGQGDDAVCLPSNATDDVYRELVASFAHDPFVIFGIANEPGGMSAKDAAISSLMSHAVGVIRAAEDALGAPHHLVAVQGNQWTSKIGFYNSAPLPHDNVVYEYHSYPPEATGTYGYTQSNIPVIIGEYGPLNGDQSFLSAFLADVEAKQIPNVAWSVSPYSNCAPDLVSVTRTTTLTPNTWGTAVKQYLTSH